jgi:hypothetical protein
MSCFPVQHISKQRLGPSGQLETLQDDLLRVSDLLNQLSGLSEKEIVDWGIVDRLEEIHLCLKRFEVSCQNIHMALYEDEFADSVDEESFESNFPENKNWTAVRKEAKRAHKLAGQLTGSLKKIRASLEECPDQCAVPDDQLQANREVGSVVSELASGWIQSQE